jgi:hypothetical protein
MNPGRESPLGRKQANVPRRFSTFEEIDQR